MVKIGILNSVFVRLWLLVHILYVNSQEKSNFVDKGLDSANIEYIHMETMKSRSSIKKRANFVPHPDTMHELTFAVKQSNADKIHNMLMERSTPGQPLYQRWISHDEVRALTSNPDASYTLLKWFEEQKLSLVWSSKNQEYFRVRTSISHWERILRTSFYEYHEVFGVRTLRTHTSAIRAESYSLPVTIAKHVHTVFGASQFPVPIRRLGSSRFSNSELKTSFATPPLVTPLTLATQYAIPIRNGSALASQSVFETQSMYFSPSDLKQFQNKFNLFNQTALVKAGYATTGTCGFDNCGEGNLDIQYIMGISQHTPSTYWYVTNTTEMDPFLLYLIQLGESSKPPLVNSISWGGIEQFYEPSFLELFAQEAIKLSLRGVTILASSGDEGVANYGGSYCDPSQPVFVDNCACNYDSSSDNNIDGVTSSQSKNVYTGVGYFPSFPASCPYVTAVGGTQLSTLNTEITCSSSTGGLITSGGGFSSYYNALEWQTEPINNYFKITASQNNNPISGYNNLGRGYPDVSMNAVNYNVILGGLSKGVYGTSASAPVLAALLSNINGVRLAAGKGPVGFINPTLYANPNAFNDITVGDIKCTTNICCQSGFVATAGWDPATGMGSVQFAALEKIFSNVSTSPDLFFSPSLYPAFVTPSAPVSNNSSTNRVNPTTVYIIIGCVIGGVAVLSLLLIFVRSRLSGTAYDGYPNTTSLSAPSVHTTASFYSTSEVSNVIAIQGERPILSQQSSFGVQPLQQKAVSIY